MNNLTENEKEIILQAMDLIIEDTKYATNYGTEELQKYRNNKLKTAKEIKIKLQDIFKNNELKNSNLKKAIFTLLYDQFNIPDMEECCNDLSYIDYIINALIEKNENVCPFKNYDCIGHCKNNIVGCADGLIGFTVGCNREVEKVWKDFIGVEGD